MSKFDKLKRTIRHILYALLAAIVFFSIFSFFAG
uniref:Uncharacterized protein n=1 Tax=Dulem virus 140 TaxID=3145617 RepID=A0AAU8AUS4_9VIRU